MNFTKGAIMGIIAGTVVGAMNSESIKKMFNKGTREMKKVAKRYGV